MALLAKTPIGGRERGDNLTVLTIMRNPTKKGNTFNTKPPSLSEKKYKMREPMLYGKI